MLVRDDTKAEGSMDFMSASSLNQQSRGLLQRLASCAPHLMIPPPAHSASCQLCQNLQQRGDRNTK